MAIGILINPRTFEPRVAYQHKTGVYFTSLGGTKEAGDGSLELEDYMPQTPEEQASGYARSHVNRVREKNNGDGTVMYTALGLATERIVAGEVRETRVPARAGVCSVPRGGGLEDTPRWHQAEAWWDNARTKYGLAHRIVVPDPRFRGEGLVEVDVYPFERALAANLVGCIFGGVEVSLSGPPFNPSDVVSVNPNVLLAMDLSRVQGRKKTMELFTELMRRAGISSADIDALFARARKKLRSDRRAMVSELDWQTDLRSELGYDHFA